ncbi:MAG TPA: alpha/beta hydrolase [Acidimicrobiales bacterium]|nr:alpha/beta hydrolase [Acidimicrobiales bacterium]
MATAAINGTELFHEELGEGPAVLVLHGGPGFDHTYFRPAFDRLRADHRLIYLDHRHQGRSGRPPIATLTIEQSAEDAAALLDHLGVDRAVVAGHSYGGFVAQELALRHPDLIAGLFLISTTPGQLGATDDPDADPGPRPPEGFVEAITTIPATDAAYAAMAPIVLPYYFHRLTWEEVAPTFADTRYDSAAFVRGMEVLRSWSSVDRLDRVTAPTLVLVGRHDVTTSWPQSVRIARRIPTSELVILENSGHFPWMEEPDAFWTTTDAWLASLPAS